MTSWPAHHFGPQLFLGLSPFPFCTVFISKHPDLLAEAIIATDPSHDQASTPASAASSMMRDHGSMKYFPVEWLWTTGLRLIWVK